MRVFVIQIFNRLLKPLGLTISSSKNFLLYYQHDYGEDGYVKYRNTQIYHNKTKISSVWADEVTIKYISDYLINKTKDISCGICHGTRRGYEQAEFSRILGCPVIGTEISDTAENFPNTVRWDFHNTKDEWINKHSFVYSNSLDQAFDPQKALLAWVNQLTRDGLLFIEHTMLHSALGSSEMDPFGAHPMIMPYLIFKWGKGIYELIDILEPPHKKPSGIDVWIFVIRRSVNT